MSNDDILTLQELVSHQGEDITRLSDELYAQQKEIAQLRHHIALLESKLQAVADRGQEGDAVNVNVKPPHY